MTASASPEPLGLPSVASPRERADFASGHREGGQQANANLEAEAKAPLTTVGGHRSRFGDGCQKAAGSGWGDAVCWSSCISLMPTLLRFEHTARHGVMDTREAPSDSFTTGKQQGIPFERLNTLGQVIAARPSFRSCPRQHPRSQSMTKLTPIATQVATASSCGNRTQAGCSCVGKQGVKRSLQHVQDGRQGSHFLA